MHISHKPTHKHRIKSSRCCGSTHYKTTLHVQSAHTQGLHVKCMKHTTKLARKYEQSPTYFSTLPHVLEKERTAGPCRQSPFFSFPVVVGVWLGTWFCSLLEGGHCFAECETFEVSEAPVPVPFWRNGPFIWTCRSTRGSSDHVCLLLVKLDQTLQLLISLFNSLNCFPPLLLR